MPMSCNNAIKPLKEKFKEYVSTNSVLAVEVPILECLNTKAYGE